MLSRKSKWNLGRGLILSAMASALLGCTPERDPNTLFAPEGIGILVIDAVLIVDQPQPLIKLSRTLAPDVPFTQENAAETGADIYIRNAATGASELYEDVLGFPGFYQAAGTGFTVEPETEYELFLRSTEDEVLSARTTTPARFQVQDGLEPAYEASEPGHPGFRDLEGRDRSAAPAGLPDAHDPGALEVPGLHVQVTVGQAGVVSQFHEAHGTSGNEGCDQEKAGW